MFCLWKVTNNATSLRERISIVRASYTELKYKRIIRHEEPPYVINGQAVQGLPATFKDTKKRKGKCLTFWEGSADLNQVI